MPQPTAYSRQYNFTDRSTSNPSDPLPGTQIDAELNQVKTNLDGINTNIGLIQRDDGQLANASVGNQQFGVDALALIGASGSGFNIKGAWAATTAYVAGDLVDNNQATYYCITAHTSASAFSTNESKFVLIANAAISSSAVQVEKFTGNGSTVAFTLSTTYGSDKDVMVFVGGSLKTPQSESSGTDTASYSISGPTLTFVSAPPSSSTPNVFVWGTSVAVEQARQSALASADTAAGHATDAGQHRTTASDWAKKADGTIVDTDTGVNSNEFSAKAYASLTGTHAPTEGSAKEWATNSGAAEVKSSEGYSSKAYAQDATTGTDTTGGSSKGWAQTAKNAQVPGASTADRSSKHYSEIASDHVTSAESAKTAAETALSTFQGTYHGSLGSAPSSGITTGDLYYQNSGSTGLYVYNGSNWETMATAAGGNTITSSDGNDLTLATNANGENVVINTGAASIKLPNVRATSNNFVLAMDNISTGSTTWKATYSAPLITSVSGELNTFENSAEDGGTLTLTGTDFGTDASAINSIKIMKSNGTNDVSATSFGTPTGTSIPNIVFNGAETNYNTFPADTTWYIQVSKNSLLSDRFSSGKSFTKDPTISAITQSVASGDYNSAFTGTGGHFGSYGGPVAGGGTDSNTKLLLNFDRPNGSTDIEDSSNSGGDGHNVTATNAIIKSASSAGISPAMAHPANGKTNNSVGVYFDGTGDYLSIPDSANFSFGTSPVTIDFWFYCTSVTNTTQTLWSGWTSGTSNQSIYIQKDSSANSFSLRWYQEYSSATSHWYTADGAIQLNTWYHVGVTRSGATLKCFLNGVDTSITVDNPITSSEELGDFGTHNIGRRGDAANYFIGYIDSFRIQTGVAQTFTTSPLKIYGAYGPENPSIGTIEITTATDDDVNVAYSFQGSTEDNASVLGSSSDLAIASDTSGANKKKGTLTGTLQGTTGSVTNLRIQAKANNDANRLVEVNEATGVGAISFTKVGTGKPVLFNARRYVGNGLARELNGFGFKPDFVWLKNRDDDQSHMMYDSLRGTDSYIYSDLHNGPGSSSVERVSFTADGIALASGQTNNADTKANIAWGWKAGGAPSASAISLSGGIGAGTIADDGNRTATTQSVNQNSGFCITEYTGGNDGAGSLTIPHSLGVTPEFIIVKRLTTQTWIVWHKDLSVNTNVLHLDTNVAQQTNSQNTAGHFGTQTSTNIVLTGGTGSNNNIKGNSIVYAWKSVSGVSKFESYTGNSSTGTNGKILDIGFFPRWIMIKCITDLANWIIWDTFRSGAAASGDTMLPRVRANTNENDDSSANEIQLYESGSTKGVQLRTSEGGLNNSSRTYIYMAFA